MTTPTSAIVWRGPSAFDPSVDVLVVLTGLRRPSANPKTGPMVQSWILRADMRPWEAVSAGEDAPICGTCPFSAGRGCYVTVANAPQSIYRAMERGSIADMDPETAMRALQGKKLRIGAYGDPAAVPLSLWETLLTFTAGHTGYTHDWRRCDQRFAGIVMASCETASDVIRAESRGYRAFLVSRDAPTESALTGRRIITCPASAEAGHRTTCADCGLCNGSHWPDNRAHITIRPHGAQSRRIQ